MVYTGKPSRGCHTCRKRRIKCDEGKPSCLKCTKTGRVCPGYRDEFDLIFRNENASAASKAGEPKASEKQQKNVPDAGSSMSESPSLQSVALSGSQELDSTHAGPSNSSLSDTPEWFNSPFEEWLDSTGSSASPGSSLMTTSSPHGSPLQGIDDLSPIPYSLSLPPEFEAKAFFFKNFVLLPHNSHEAGRGFLELLGPMFNHTRASSPLHKATEAIAMSALATFPQRRELRAHAKTRYGQALKGLTLAIADPTLSKSDETLLTILLCSLYEVMASTNESVAAWINHIDGAVALVRMRGKEQYNNPHSRQLAHAVRTAALNCCVQRAKRLDFPESEDWDNNAETNAANRLTRISCPLPDIRARAAELRASTDVQARGLRALALIKDSQDVEVALENWYLTLPEAWGYKTLYVVREVPDDVTVSNHWFGPVHVYDDLISANVINDCRVGRIFCQAVIRDCADWAEEAGLLSQMELDELRQNAQYITQHAVDEICSSVPFHVGSDMQIQREMAQPQGQDSAASAAVGGYFLVWPLYVSSFASGIPDKQRDWIQCRLNRIGEVFGLTPDQVLVLAQRQVITCSPSYP